MQRCGTTHRVTTIGLPRKAIAAFVYVPVQILKDLAKQICACGCS